MKGDVRPVARSDGGAREEMPDDRARGRAIPSYWPGRPEAGRATRTGTARARGGRGVPLRRERSARTTSAGSSRKHVASADARRGLSGGRRQARVRGRAGLARVVSGRTARGGRARDAPRLRTSLRARPEGVRCPIHASREGLDPRGGGAVEGDATTDFGAPSIAPKADARADRPPVARRARRRSSARAGRRSIGAAERVDGPLAKGPRGGGREVDAIVAHVVGAEASYAAHDRGEGAGVRRGRRRPPRDEERTIVSRGAGTRASPTGSLRKVRAAGSGGRRGTSFAGPRGTSSITRGRSRIVPQRPAESAPSSRRRCDGGAMPRERCSSSSAASAS